MQTKYIFMTGGVCSGLGKGVTAASLGRLLKARGLKVTIQKFDPYINRLPGLLNPNQHGEVYVTEDGTEVDLDLGHYERFIDENLSVNNSVSAGKIYWEVLNRERQRGYQGRTIQVIPHITDAIKEYIRRAGHDAQSDVIISEIGGTVGDIESLPFLEAIRQISHDVGYSNVMYVHVTLVPFLNFAAEMKSKPSQHSVKELLSLGIKPDALVCRTEQPLTQEMRSKLSRFCNVDISCVIENANTDFIYEVPLLLEAENFGSIVCKRLGLDTPAPDLSEWRNLVALSKNPTRCVNIGLVGKYEECRDAYLSVLESLQHAGIAKGVDVQIKWIFSKDIEQGDSHFKGIDGILLPGGYGDRDIPGLVHAAGYARRNKLPFFGIGLGMQCAMLEFARNVSGLSEADSEEFNKDTAVPFIERINRSFEDSDDTQPMRRGAIPCKLTEGSLIHGAYGESLIYERFRHLYKVNNQYRSDISAYGLIESALSPDGQHVEAIELPTTEHPWFVGVQFHPEFKSRITRPSPLFNAFLGACIKE